MSNWPDRRGLPRKTRTDGGGIDVCYLGLSSPANSDFDSTEAEDRVRRVRLLERSNLLRRQSERKGGHRILKMMRLGCAYKGRCDDRLTEHPGESKLGAGNAPLFR